MIDWREIKGRDIDWTGLIPSRRIAHMIKVRFDAPGPYVSEFRKPRYWPDWTLGQACNAGISAWERFDNWGPMATASFKNALRQIANDPTTYAGKAADAFDPEAP